MHNTHVIISGQLLATEQLLCGCVHFWRIEHVTYKI